MAEKSTIKILVADDEESIRSIVTEVLRDEGYEVEMVADGTAALERVKQGDIHVVITDIRMPEMTGIELLENIKAFNSDIEVIIMTSHASTDTAIQAVRLGAYDYLTKPFEDLDIIPAVVDRTVGKLKLELEVKKLLGALKKKNEEMHTLYNQTTQLFDTLNAHEILQLALKALVELSGKQTKTAFFAYSDKSNSLNRSVTFPEEDSVDGQKQEVTVTKKSLTEKFLQTINANKTLKADLCGNRAAQSLLYPLLIEKEFNGVFVICPENQPLDDDDQALIRQYIDNVAMQMEKAKLHATVETMAIKDGLTQIYNRRYFEATLESELARAQRFDNELSLILLDVDHFKHYNDTNGHLMGDTLLKEMAALLTKTSRNIDVVARYGGEEFVLILVETNKMGAAIKAENLRKSVAGHDFANGDKQPLGSITVSGGFAGYPEDGKTVEELIDAADKALYKAKEAGRNRMLPAGYSE